jgi:putative membrane protein
MGLIATAAPVADINWNHMGAWSVFDWLLMVAFWALVIFAVVWLVRELAGRRDDERPDAGQILERRLATGEIDVEEYRERRAALERGSRPLSQS